MYLYDDVEGGAPRLPVQSITSRVVLTGVLVCCCGIIAFSMLFVASLFATLPRPSLPAPTVGAGAAVVAIDTRTTTHVPRSVLQRLAMLRRASAPARGIDHDGVRTVFPHWLTAAGEWDTPVVLDDTILALSYLARDAETDIS